MRSLENILSIVNNEVEKLNWPSKPEGLYEPIIYTMKLGGKRLRPALTLLACDMFSGNIDDAVKPALGIEVFHNFTLLHDDIMDKALMRRGQPTVHIKWSPNHAILSGDLMQIYAYKLISETPASCLKEVIGLFSTTAKEVCEGQQYDMNFELIDEVTPEDYIMMIRLKTAVILGSALKIGAIIAGAKAQDCELIYDFGINLGLAFQLKDDLLDVYGDENTFGKKIGGDILCNKKTYLLIQAKKKAQTEIKDELEFWLKTKTVNSSDKIFAVTAIYNQLGVRKICEDAMFFYFEKAIAAIDAIDVDSDKKQELRKLAEKLMYRYD